jgi:Dyp-type peroxidase family
MATSKYISVDMNLRPGIDTHPPDFFLLIKLDLGFDGRDEVIGLLQAMTDVDRRKTASNRSHGKVYCEDKVTQRPQLVVKDLGLNLLVGFGLSFFLGPLRERKDEEAVPNFPPGGVFKPRLPQRFGINDRHVPLYLRTMNVLSDRECVKLRLKEGGGGTEPSDNEVEQSYIDWLSRGESDLFLVIESNNRFLTIDFWDSIKEALKPFNITIVSLQDAFNRGDKRDHVGYHDGVGNLQERMLSDPTWYRSKIYLPNPAPAYPGEPDWARDDPRYDGGTYLVHRRFVEHLDKWNSEAFEVRDSYGKTFRGYEARQHAIGRDVETGNIISRFDGKQLNREPDATEVNMAYNESHVLKARGGVTAPFAAPFPPLDGKETNVFNTQDIRIRRRGVNFCEIHPVNGSVTYGLHFLCFQNNIQQTGFEFIQNVWLDNPMFRRSRDGLFDLENGIIEPVEGCYYFIPPPYRKYHGDVFFE